MTSVTYSTVTDHVRRGDELGVDVEMPNQIRWGFGGRGGRSAKSALDIPELIGSA